MAWIGREQNQLVSQASRCNQQIYIANQLVLLTQSRTLLTKKACDWLRDWQNGLIRYKGHHSTLRCSGITGTIDTLVKLG